MGGEAERGREGDRERGRGFLVAAGKTEGETVCL